MVSSLICSEKLQEQCPFHLFSRFIPPKKNITFICKFFLQIFHFAIECQKENCRLIFPNNFWRIPSKSWEAKKKKESWLINFMAISLFRCFSSFIFMLWFSKVFYVSYYTYFFFFCLFIIYIYFFSFFFLWSDLSEVVARIFLLFQLKYFFWSRYFVSNGEAGMIKGLWWVCVPVEWTLVWDCL